MKVENGNIILDDEIIDLTKVMNIGLTGWGSPFEAQKYCISFEYATGGNSIMIASITTSKSKLLNILNKLYKEIAREGNDSFANLGFILVNMDNVNSVDYNKDEQQIVVTSISGYTHKYSAPSILAKRTLAKMETEYNKYNQTRVQNL